MQRFVERRRRRREKHKALRKSNLLLFIVLQKIGFKMRYQQLSTHYYTFLLAAMINSAPLYLENSSPVHLTRVREESMREFNCQMNRFLLKTRQFFLLLPPSLQYNCRQIDLMSMRSTERKF